MTDQEFELWRTVYLQAFLQGGVDPEHAAVKAVDALRRIKIADKVKNKRMEKNKC